MEDVGSVGCKVEGRMKHRSITYDLLLSRSIIRSHHL